MDIFFFYAGIAFAYTHSFYAILAIFLAIFLRFKLKIIFWFVLSFCWANLHQYWISNTAMPENSILQKAIIQGYIQSIPNTTETKTSFDFYMSKLNGKSVSVLTRLSCYRDCKTFRAGENWQFSVKLKRPRNLGNPGSFDYKGSLNAHHIHWTGYIKSHPNPLLLRKASRNTLDALREGLAKQLSYFQLDKEVLGIIEAMTLGVTNHIDKDKWILFRETGTTHLMVISGSHIVLIAGFFYYIFNWCWSRSNRLCLFKPAPMAASLVAIMIAFLYSLLAGFAIPVQRAFFSYCLFGLKNFLARPFSTWQIWRYALLLILIIEPHAVLFPGFYLSFLAVALLFGSNNYLSCGKWVKIILIQILCLIGLMPLTLFWFSYGAVNSLFANLIAIPLVGFVIVPLSLLTVIIIQFVSWPWVFVPLSAAIHFLLRYLQWISTFSIINVSVYLPSIVFALAISLGLCLLLLIPEKRLRPAAVILVLAGFLPKKLHVAEGEAKIDVLDVGQGLSVVVTTQKHTLIYDTGVKFYKGSDMGEMAILPYLASIGRKKIDTIVISHPDLDHRGGLATLLNSLPVKELLVDNVAFYKRGKNCHNYAAWDWDGVHFQFLPLLEKFKETNNRSCILSIRAKKNAVLLTGDIEKLAEYYLIAHYKKELSASVLIVPHHGSKTSSSLPFIQTVSPGYAVISAGFDNRYHFPHQQTLDNYQKLKIPIVNTATYGMVSFILGRDQNNILSLK